MYFRINNAMTVIQFTPYTLNIKGRLIDIDRPQVMGILNVTPDSFYANSRLHNADAVKRRVESMIADGVDWLDLGAYSSRPGADNISPQEEIDRLGMGMNAIRQIAPNIIVSVDTFRADVAGTAIAQMDADIINDISGGNLDSMMFETVASLKNIPYILMHMRGTPATMNDMTEYRDVTSDTLAELGEKVNRLALLGVNDIIIDPGFGFAKTTKQNFSLLHNLNLFHLFKRPLLVGFSRKSMVYHTLNTTPDKALNGTTVLNTIALLSGASILRVHDVRQASEAVKLVTLTLNS